MTDVLGLIRKNREARGWTEYQLAERSGLPQSTISSWYQKGMTPSFSSLEKICDAFGLTLSQFFADGEALLALTPGQRGMLEKWLRLSPAQQRALFAVMDAMLELSRTGLGLVAVCDAQQQVQGVFTDGDLRRWLVGGGALTTPVNEAMTVGGTTLQSQSRAIDAKEILMKRKITAAPVVDENGKLTGAINLQDFYQAGII